MKLKLRKKIVLLVFITIFLLGLLATAIVFYFVKNNVIDIESKNLEVITYNSTLELSRFFVNTRLIAETIALQPELKTYFTEPIEQDEEVLKLLKRYDIGNLSEAIYLLSRSGDVLVSTDESFLDNNYSFRRYFQEALSGNKFIDMAVGVTSQEAGYYISVPVRDSSENISGVLVIKLKPEALHKLIRTSGMTSSGHVMLVDNYGVIVYSDKKDRIYKSLGGLDFFERKEIEKSQKYLDKKIESLDYSLLLDQIRENKKQGVIDLYDNLSRKNKVLAYSQIGDYPFYLILEEDEKNLNFTALRFSFILGGLVFALAMLAVIIIIIGVLGFLKPMVFLLSEIKNIISHNIDDRINIKTGDELEELADIFNKLLDRMKKSRKNIENKIDKRTKELEKFNNLMIGRELRMIELKKETERLKNNLEKEILRNWSDRFGEGLLYEEEIIRELESVYMFKVKNSKLPKTKKEKIKKLINKLIVDSKRHNKVFKELIKKHGGK
jgi:C4-dicarboxylate-specific signal transduction histidine kinase